MDDLWCRIPRPDLTRVDGAFPRQPAIAAKWAETAPVELSQPDAPYELHLDALGSGSDYTAFLDHLGIPSFDFGFRGDYGVYHSIYDNFNWMAKFGDPQFLYHATAARFYGLLAMRLASAEVLPLRFGSYARSLGVHLDDLRRRVVRQARTPPDPKGKDKKRIELDDFEPVLEALAAFEAAGEKLDAAVAELVRRQDAAAAGRVNPLLMQVERAFLSTTDGLPRRPWFRHLLYAPGLTTGYAPWPFPEMAEGVENADGDFFTRGVSRVVEAIGKATRILDDASVAAR